MKPPRDFTFKDMAIAFIKSDKIHNQGKRAEIDAEGFHRPQILPADLPAETLEVDDDPPLPPPPPRMWRRTVRLFQSVEQPSP